MWTNVYVKWDTKTQIVGEVWASSVARKIYWTKYTLCIEEPMGFNHLAEKAKYWERTLLSSLLWAMPESKHSSSREVSKYGIPMIFLGYHGDKHAKGKCHCTASTASRSVSSSSTNFLVSTFVVILVLLSNIQYRQYRSISTTIVRRRPSTVHKKGPLLSMVGSLITN